MDRILVNDRCLFRGGTGVAMYLRNVLACWPGDCSLRPVGFWRQLPRLYQRLLSGPQAQGVPPMQVRPLAEMGPPTRLARRLPHWARRVLQWRYGRRFAKAFRRGRYAGYFEPNSLAVPVGGLTVTACPDLSVLEYPEWHPADRVAQWRADLEASIRNTTHWVTISEFSRWRMMELLGLPGEQVTVIPLAARPLPGPAEGPDRPRPAGFPERFFLHLGTLEPRKNIELLLTAWALLPDDLRRHTALVLAGGVGWGTPEYFRGLMEHPAAREVLWTGYVSDADAAWLLASATGVVVPSHYEGFGLPILEAMAAGAPVICSTADAFREVAGEAADMLDPADAPAWASAMRRVAEDAAWRQARRQAGFLQAAKFDWKVTARRHAELFESLLAGRPNAPAGAEGGVSPAESAAAGGGAGAR